MPRKRRKSKVQPDDLIAWEMIFQAGSDYFGDAKDAGIEVDEYGRADDATVAEAWQRLGAEYMETWTDKHSEPWALREFGQPAVRRRRR
ncbi:hypothetical protein GGE16_002651 [Rhizobium leguminosarum]|uniref:Uncharacterized protein n=1 Tax=Rhizobium leguminosarum TaxID=384 RepID=A0AAE2MJJ6_RHILE|nr:MULTISPECIES: hypothetical protein [Rhizobium]MBB4290611.1 hypothetical protein [Rhizobium leguminosarum]MBB4297316.1 hypothetical protein [Rhizobium leguminosarum]MBB4307484.1 hypothetical protein [Rhizobium leguminosarum]MBB4415258.1 hypothetical protein [Rhizobium leguminosarum]MBB4431775.1 hypothetical protein [Rhizobium esperanzae]